MRRSHDTVDAGPFRSGFFSDESHGGCSHTVSQKQKLGDIKNGTPTAIPHTLRRIAIFKFPLAVRLLHIPFPSQSSASHIHISADAFFPRPRVCLLVNLSFYHLSRRSSIGRLYLHWPPTCLTDNGLDRLLLLPPQPSVFRLPFPTLIPLPHRIYISALIPSCAVPSPILLPSIFLIPDSPLPHLQWLLPAVFLRSVLLLHTYIYYRLPAVITLVLVNDPSHTSLRRSPSHCTPILPVPDLHLACNTSLHQDHTHLLATPSRPLVPPPYAASLLLNPILPEYCLTAIVHDRLPHSFLTLRSPPSTIYSAYAERFLPPAFFLPRSFHSFTVSPTPTASQFTSPALCIPPSPFSYFSTPPPYSQIMITLTSPSMLDPLRTLVSSPFLTFFIFSFAFFPSRLSTPPLQYKSPDALDNDNHGSDSFLRAFVVDASSRSTAAPPPSTLHNVERRSFTSRHKRMYIHL
ncbi:hypothetical protein B0H13DRAFT_2348402 [Mycena leptocephala]|nr:hypothetical protein B0H13DRAFT_2348402 [Mycena leptocephala]